MFFTLISSLPIANTKRVTFSEEGCMSIELVRVLVWVLVWVSFSHHPYTQSAYIDSSVRCFHRAANYGRTLRGRTCLAVCLSGDYYNWHVQGHSEVPGIISEQFVIYIETTRAEIFDNENSRCSRVSFTERMVPP